MIKKALLLLLLTAAWAFGSWWYYTCMIKGFCRANGTLTSPSEQITNIEPAKTISAAIATDSPEQMKPSTSTDLVDQDSDFISDEDERSVGTNPDSDDSDSDGIKDKDELGDNLQTPIDSDGDGIINALDEDDDNDGIPTALESSLGSNPLSADSDSDGISDGDEVGSDTSKPLDTDGDGIIDLIDANNESDTEQSTDQAQQPNKDEVTVDTIQDSSTSSTDIPIQKSRLYFPFRSANPSLSKVAEQYFKEVSEWLSQSQNHSVVLTGHTDSIGQAKNNLNLGLKRAIEIKDLMVKLGAKPAQIDVASMGETQPIASNKTEAGRYQNRRVELIPAIKNK